MRNFKKFLALVLAMLMVSACAVSVSAAYGDQAAIDATGYADAVAVLSDLSVIKGDGENFRPNGTLTRAEAAVIAAKLYAGAAGQSYEWTAATTSFVDVDAAWSFAYINYVAQRGIMDGIGGNKFDPNGTLSLAQALTIAVKVAGLQSKVADLTKVETPAYWATHWIAVAGEYGFDKGVDIWDYDAPCSRATMAQIAFNVLNYEKEKDVFPFIEKFDLVVVKTQIASVGDVVTFENGATANLAAFNAKLNAAGFEGTAADYIDHNVTITYANKANVIYSVEITTVDDDMIYSDARIENVKDKDGNLTSEIKIDGVTYTVAATAGSETNTNAGIGSGTSVSNSIVVNGFAAKEAVPTYYKAIAYDDNADGKFDRLDVDTYQIAKLVKGDEFDHDANADTAKVIGTKIDYFDPALTDAGNAYLTLNGAGFTAWGEAPVLVYVENGAISIIEEAKTATGLVSTIKDNTYITVGGTQYNFAGKAFVAPEAWVLGQNITIYTINGKFVAVASADTGVTSGMVTKVVLVDNVVLEGDAAVVSGYEFSGSSLAPISLKVIGAETNGRLKSKPAGLMNDAFVDAEHGIDYNKDGKFTEADNAFTAVALGDIKDDKFVPDANFKFNDKAFYTFKVTSAGAYFVTAGGAALPATAESGAAVAIDGSYVKVGGVAKFKLAPSYLIVADVAANTEKAYNFYSATYSIALNGAISANTNLKYVAVAADATIVTYDNAISKDVALIYIDGIAAAEAPAKTVAALAEGESIVQIVAAENYSLDLNTYKAVDIFTGEVVYVTSAADDIAPKSYATVKDGAIVTTNTKWIGSHNITVTGVLAGKPDTITAYNSYLLCDKDGNVKSLEHYTDDANKFTFGLDNVKAMKYNDDGILVVNGDFKVSDLYTASSVYGFISGGKVIILPNA